MDRAAVSGAPLLLAVSGGNGIGKSTLAVTLAYELTDVYADAIYLGQGSGEVHGSLDAADVLANLLVQLGVPWQELPPPNLRLSALRSTVSGRQLLIVLDDISSAGQVLPLLGDLTHAGVIVAGEKFLDQLRIEGFAPLRLKGLDPADGAAYIATIAGAAVAGTDQAVLERLVTLCGGVPRIIAAAAARLADGDEPVQEYVNRLERAATSDEMSEDLWVDNTSVIAEVLDSSYAGLTPDEAQAYRWLSLLAGSTFDLEMAAAVLEVPIPRVRRSVRELVHRSLVQAHGDGYFEFPHVMRRHAAGKAHSTDVEHDRRVLELRAIEWCLKRAVGLAKSVSDRPVPATVFREVETRYGGDAGAEQAYGEFDARWTTFVATARRTAELGRQRETVTLLIALWPFAYHTHRLTELVDGYRTLLDIAADPGMHWQILEDTGTRWQLLRDLGALHERKGEVEQADEYFRRAAEIDYLPGRASGLEWQGFVLEGRGDLEAALVNFSEAWAAVPLMGDPQHEERAYALLRMHRGRVLVALGRLVDAEPELVAAEHFFRARPRDANNAARCRVLLGDIAKQRGAEAEARQHWEAGLEVLIRFAMNMDAATVHDKLAALADVQGRSADALTHREQAQLLRSPR